MRRLFAGTITWQARMGFHFMFDHTDEGCGRAPPRIVRIEDQHLCGNFSIAGERLTFTDECVVEHTNQSHYHVNPPGDHPLVAGEFLDNRPQPPPSIFSDGSSSIFLGTYLFRQERAGFLGCFEGAKDFHPFWVVPISTVPFTFREIVTFGYISPPTTGCIAKKFRNRPIWL